MDDNPERIWLLHGVDECDGTVWSDDPDPMGAPEGEKPESTEYVRADLAEQPWRRLNDPRVGYADVPREQRILVYDAHADIMGTAIYRMSSATMSPNGLRPTHWAPMPSPPSDSEE